MDTRSKREERRREMEGGRTAESNRPSRQSNDEISPGLSPWLSFIFHLASLLCYAATTTLSLSFISDVVSRLRDLYDSFHYIIYTIILIFGLYINKFCS